MSLFQKLQQASSEEDVKDAYIKTLGLKSVRKNLIDIQTDEIWFEAKDGGKTSTYELKSREGYRQFWAIYHRPPKAEYRNYLLEHREPFYPLYGNRGQRAWPV